MFHKSKFTYEYIMEIRKMHPKKIIITGIQASGKGTQAAMLAEKYGIKHLSTGEILREHVYAGTDMAKGYTIEDMETGHLAPINVITRVMEYELQNSDNFILDGFPRSKEQLALLEANVNDIDMVIYLQLDDDAATERMKSRGRADDNDDGIAQRLKSFHEETETIIYEDFIHYPNFYVINANQSVENVFNDILTAVDDSQ